MARLRIRKEYYGYLFIAPFVIGFLLFGLYPVIHTLSLSLTDTTLMKANANFIGLKNFQRLFADKTFITAVTNMPNLMMPAAIAALFFSLFSFYGPVNQFLVRSGFLPEAVDYIRSPSMMRGLVVFIQWWMWFGQTTILLMAAITSVSTSLYEAAVVDGANTGQIFRFITLPLIKPVMLYILVTSLVGGMQMFDIPMLLTDGRGSPANSILTNNILMYMRFRSSQGHIGAASAVGVMVFIMTTAVALLIFYLLREKRERNVA